MRSRDAGKTCSAASAMRSPIPSSWRSELPQASRSAGGRDAWAAFGFTTGFIALASADFPDQRAIGRAQLDGERHAAHGVRRAAKAGIEGPHNRFDAIQHAFAHVVALHVVARRLQNAAIHGRVVVAGGN